ncbi:Rib/alpha-like domain-containing protein, partial [Streptococcus varani]
MFLKKYFKNAKFDLSKSKQRYSIKKFKIGAASVLIGLSFFGSNSFDRVLADTDSSDVTTKVTQGIADNDKINLGESSLALDDQSSKLQREIEATTNYSSQNEPTGKDQTVNVGDEPNVDNSINKNAVLESGRISRRMSRAAVFESTVIESMYYQVNEDMRANFKNIAEYKGYNLKFVMKNTNDTGFVAPFQNLFGSNWGQRFNVPMDFYGPLPFNRNSKVFNLEDYFDLYLVSPSGIQTKIEGSTGIVFLGYNFTETAGKNVDIYFNFTKEQAVTAGLPDPRDADKNEPTGKDQTVNVGDEPNVDNSINKDGLPAGTTYAYETP